MSATGAGAQADTGIAARVRPQDGVDILFAVALSVLALSGWSTTYAGPGWWIAAIVAAALGIAIAVAITDSGGGVQFVLLALVALYLLVAGPLALGRVELLGISTFEAGMTGTGESWHTLLTTHPPVDAAGAVLIPPVLLSLFGPALAVSLSVRSRKMLAPLVAPSAIFVTVLLMGQHTTGAVVAQGLAFAGVSVLWMRIRALRLEESGTGHDPARARRIAGSVALIVGASLLVAAVGDNAREEPSGPRSGVSDEQITPPLPDTELAAPAAAGRFLLRDRVSAYDAERLRTPLDAFRDYTRQEPGTEGNLFDERLLRVEGAPSGSRLRFATLDSYDGQRWKAENRTDPLRLDDRFFAMDSSIDNPAEGDRARVTVNLTGNWELPWVPTIGAVQSFEFDQSASSNPEELRYNPATGTAVMTETLEPKDSYTFGTVIEDRKLSPDDDAAPYFDTGLYDEADFLDVAAGLGRLDSTSRIDALFQIADSLRKNGRYSNGIAGFEARYQPGQSRKRLGEDFINVTPTVGDDEQYAAAFALLANRIGVPARVVVGAVVPKNGVVEGRDVQAWVEVRLADASWATVPTELFMSKKPPVAPGAVSGGPKPRSFPDPKDRANPLDQPDPQDDLDATKPDPDSGSSSTWLLLLLLPLALLVGVPPLLKWLRRRRRKRARSGALRYAGAWAELVDGARDLGHDVPAHLTRPAQARVLVSAGGGDDQEWTALAQEADRRVFAAVDPDVEQADRFWDSITVPRSQLRESAKPWRRWWSRFTLASLRRR